MAYETSVSDQYQALVPLHYWKQVEVLYYLPLALVSNRCCNGMGSPLVASVVHLLGYAYHCHTHDDTYHVSASDLEW